MPLIHDSVSGATWYDADASKYAGSARYTVSADTAGGTQTGMGYDPQVGQQQWALDYALRSGTAAGQQATNQYGAETGRLNAQTQQYGAQTSRALGAGDLYRQLFGLPDNYAATANLLRGAPNASPAHFWGALQGLAPLGHSPNFGAMKTLDANKAVSGFFGAAGASGGSGGGGSSGGGGGGGSGGDTSDIKWKRDYHQAVRDAGFGTGSAAREAANASIGMGEAAAAHEIKHHRNPYKGGAKFAAGGSLTVPAAGHTARTFVATDPLHFRVGPQPFIVGERSKDELVDIAPAAGGGTRVTVAPLQNPAVPVPAYAASLANDLVPGSPYRPTPLGPLGAQPFIGLPPTPPMGGAQMGYAAYSGPPIPDTRLVIPRLGGAGGSAHGGWSGVYPPESETLPLSPIGTVPLTPMPPSLQDRPRIALAMGGAVGVPPPSAGFGGIRDLPPIRYEGGGGTTVPALPPTLSLADRYSQQWGLDDPNVLRALIMAESTGDPNAVGDNGNSIGLLQANMAGGRGQGYTADQLRDPDFNLSIAQPEITSTYAAGKAQGLAGRDLTRYVAVHAQRPDPTTYDRYSNWYDSLASGQSVAPSAGDPSLQAQQPQAPAQPNPFGALHMAAGGQATVYGTPRQPATLYGNTTPTYATSTPNAAGQVTAPAASGHGNVTIPYYEGTGYADPTTADPRVVRRLDPMELSLLDATSRAQHGIDLNMWNALFRNSLSNFQQASTQSAWTRAS